MKRKIVFLTAFACLFFALSEANAQFNTPNINGVIAANEYGVHIDGQNQKNTGSGQMCFLTWDDSLKRERPN